MPYQIEEIILHFGLEKINWINSHHLGWLICYRWLTQWWTSTCIEVFFTVNSWLKQTELNQRLYNQIKLYVKILRPDMKIKKKPMLECRIHVECNFPSLNNLVFPSQCMFSCQYNHIHYIHWHDIHSKMVSIINIYTLPPPYTYSLIYPTMHKWNHISAHFIDSFQRFFSKISFRLIV